MPLLAELICFEEEGCCTCSSTFPFSSDIFEFNCGSIGLSNPVKYWCFCSDFESRKFARGRKIEEEGFVVVCGCLPCWQQSCWEENERNEDCWEFIEEEGRGGP